MFIGMNIHFIPHSWPEHASLFILPLPGATAAAGIAKSLPKAFLSSTVVDWMPPPDDKDSMRERLSKAQKAAASPPQLEGIKPRPIESAAVIGSGTMGAGIAMCFAEAGIPITLHDTSQGALDKALASMRKTWESAAKKGKIAAQEVEERLCRVKTRTTLDNEYMKATDLVIEAVFENMEVKKAVFSTLDRVCKDTATLATNTSTLNVDDIFASIRNKDMAVGMHFFSPANVMPLLENIKGAHSSPETLATAMAVGRMVRKTAVLSGNCFGFIGNRMFEVYTREALFLLEEGALPHQIDAALESWGMAMGPLAVGDLAGLDIGYSIRKEQGLTDASTRAPATGRYGGTIGTILAVLLSLLEAVERTRSCVTTALLALLAYVLEAV
jgi:3-hydroxyacyl-CoA dehydrogenase